MWLNVPSREAALLLVLWRPPDHWSPLSWTQLSWAQPLGHSGELCEWLCLVLAPAPHPSFNEALQGAETRTGL